jgi:two-component system sensor kinase FixL
MDACSEEKKHIAVLESAVENTNEAFVTIDENHRVFFFNKAAEKIFGYGREEVIGHDLNVIMSPTCSRDHRKAVARYVRTGVPRRIGHATEIMATRKSGESFPASISFSVSEVGGRLYFTAIVQDLTEMKSLQERMIRSERLAALGQVVAEISHEIKNPLMLIGGFARQLIKETKDEKALKKLNIISEEVMRLESLLKDMKTFYLPRTLKAEEVDINSLLQEIHDLTRSDCRAKKIQTHFKTHGGRAVVKGDREKLKQVFLNLVTNSTEAMENGGRLSMESDVHEDRVEVRIADEGCGIPEKEREKIFSPFYTTKRHGTGLGLSISKSIIEEHAGSTFTVESEEGKGTVFTVSIPLIEDGTNHE